MRVVTGGVVGLWLTPVISVGLAALGMPYGSAIAAGLLVASGVGLLLARPLADAVAPAVSGRPLLAAVALLVAAAAIIQIGRVSVFIVDSRKAAFSAVSSEPWRTSHCCMTAYAEAAMFAGSRDLNIYDPTLYEPRQVGPLKVDAYHYPPPFLLVPRAFRLITTDFFRMRELWFAMQALVLGSTVVGLALWIGGLAGAWALLTGVALLAVPIVLFALQIGNFQTTAVSIAVVSVILLLTGRFKSGSLLLAYVAVSKIFPGILIVYLAAARRWRALAWVAGSGVALLLLTLAVFGPRPFLDFVGHELPGITSGAAFPQSERPSVAGANQSIYGLTVRLRMLGVRNLDQHTGLQVASVYGLLIVGLASVTGWRGRRELATSDGRAELVVTVLALLSLASFRSPFVGGGYGLVSTFWTLAMMTAAARKPSARLLWMLAFVILAEGNGLTPSAAPGNAPTTFWLAVSAALFSFAVVIDTWAVARGTLLPRRVAPEATATPMPLAAQG